MTQAKKKTSPPGARWDIWLEHGMRHCDTCGMKIPIEETRIHSSDYQMPVWLQENSVPWFEEKREPAVRHVRLRESLCFCDRRPKTFHNLLR